jgi:hypothetical protein
VKKLVSAKIGSNAAVVIELEPDMLFLSLPRKSGLLESKKAGLMSGF